MNSESRLEERLPPGQQWVAEGKWPVIGEREPAPGPAHWSLTISGGAGEDRQWSLDELEAMPQVTKTLDIHCVTRWSMPDAIVEGVLLETLLDEVTAKPESKFISFVARSTRRHSTTLEIQTAIELGTIIALKFNGEPVPEGHGGPIRNIVPGRYFYKSVKWLEQIELLEQDLPGFWEAESGYHNEADPWKEQRYMAPTVDRRTAAKLIESRDFSGHDLRSIRLSGMQLDGLLARKALLRDARFDDASLEKADFSNANLSNSHFTNANLRGAKFVDTDLEGADLSGADLRMADMTGCFLTGASFCRTAPDGTVTEAQIDESTTLPENLLTPLTPFQLEFVSRRLGRDKK
ncbi:MAG: molybdopterin-dependent oxidoreductase [Planctomycetota bacterium]